MTSPSVSFRISRHTQDLAETVHALSQRLVAMEQRLLALEQQLQTLRLQPAQDAEAEVAGLAPVEAHIERLLQDCRQLLADQPAPAGEPSGSADDTPAPWPGSSDSSHPSAALQDVAVALADGGGEAPDESTSGLEAA